MTLSSEQWLLLALMAAGWLYYSNQSTAPLPAPAVTGSNGGSTVSTDNTTAPNYGLPGWQDLGSKFFTGE